MSTQSRMKKCVLVCSCFVCHRPHREQNMIQVDVHPFVVGHTLQFSSLDWHSV